MNGKVIFVGLHNKPGKVPLSTSTKSGKLIDRIANELRHSGITVVKTNLFNIEYVPKKDEIDALAFDWLERVELFKDDVIVLLGQMVHYSFPKMSFTTPIKIAHPASKRSHVEMDEYVRRTIMLIKERIISNQVTNKLKEEIQ